MPPTSLRAAVSSVALLTFAGSARLGQAADHNTDPPGVRAVAPPVDTAILNRYEWRSIGPARGGRSIAVSGVKGRPQEGYFGATGGGLWKTTDGGETWNPVTDGQIHSGSVGAVAVSETNPDEVFIGMGEREIRGDIQPGDGVYKSMDAGKTWTHLSDFLHSDAISKIRIDPTDAKTIFVADFGKYGVPSDERGVYKSTDGGDHWRRVLYHDDSTGAVDISIDPHNPKTIYAALWQAYRVEYKMSSGGPGCGLYKSTDGGETWTNISRNPGLPTGIDGKIGVAVSGADANRVYAIVENDSGGLFRSEDAGATWALVNSSRNIRQRAFYYSDVTADPKLKDVVYVMAANTAYRSADGGKTMSQVGSGDSHDFWIDPDNSEHAMHASDGGGAISYNVGTQHTWSSRAYPTGQFYHVALTAHIPYDACGAQQDASTVCVPSEVGGGGGRGGRGGGGSAGGRGAAAPAAAGRGGGRGGATDGTFGAGGAEPGYIAPDPIDPDIIYAGGNNGSFLTRLDRRTGIEREVGPYPRMFSGEESAVLVERWQWTYPIIFSPVNPKVLYTGSQHLWKTTNGGLDWL
ncbi:MAG TPA: glycosyl hydrolase, partial [Gemmatimonadaceae bacterium]|nr:glycosyl hydrolase [Gemmatimonadaceae bacterium]